MQLVHYTVNHFVCFCVTKKLYRHFCATYPCAYVVFTRKLVIKCAVMCENVHLASLITGTLSTQMRCHSLLQIPTYEK